MTNTVPVWLLGVVGAIIGFILLFTIGHILIGASMALLFIAAPIILYFYWRKHTCTFRLSSNSSESES